MSRCPTCKRPHKRSNPQNRLYWELLHMMSAREWAGQRYSAESFHKYYAARFIGCEDLRLPNGQTMTLPRSTSSLDTAEFSAYFDRVQADAAERGVYLADLEAA